MANLDFVFIKIPKLNIDSKGLGGMGVRSLIEASKLVDSTRMHDLRVVEYRI